MYDLFEDESALIARARALARVRGEVFTGAREAVKTRAVKRRDDAREVKDRKRRREESRRGETECGKKKKKKKK